MKKIWTYVKTHAAASCIAAGVVVVVVVALCMSVSRMSVNLEKQGFGGYRTERKLDRVARRVERRIEKRMALLDEYVKKAANADNSQWMFLDLPEDMVVYRYIRNSLQAWSNQFPVKNDDINARFSRLVIPKLSNLRTSDDAPLGKVSTELTFMNIGSKWYLIKESLVEGNISSRIIAGLEVQDNYSDDEDVIVSKVNRRLGVPKMFSISPLGDSGGIPVNVDGEPMFKIFPKVPEMANPTSVFDPYVEGGGFFNSLGGLVVVALVLLLFVGSFYFARRHVYRVCRDRRGWKVFTVVLLFVLMVGIAGFAVLSLRRLVAYSDIPWRLYSWTSVNGYTLLTYIIYFCVLFCVLPLLQMTVDLCSKGVAKNVFSRIGLMVFALAVAAVFGVSSLVFGFRKEQEDMEKISQQLAIDRDFTLETILLNSEKRLAADEKIADLAQVSHGDRVILNRLTENYLVGVPKSYDISLAICMNNDASCFATYRQRIAKGTPIADGSNFSYTFDSYGRARYLGRFVYNSPENGYSTVLIDINDKSYREDRGYYSILGRRSGNGAVELPPAYSYAFYKSGRLTRYKGDSPYYNNINNDFLENLPFGQSIARGGDYLHFINKIGIGECIFVSRKRFGAVVMLVTFFYLFLVNVILLLPLFWGRFRRARPLRSNYFRTRINAVLYTSLSLTLAVMAVLCVTFIFRRNMTNRENIMADEVSSVQTALEAQYSESGSLYVVNNSEVMQALDRIGAELKADITMFLPNGKVLASTMPDIFDRFEVGSRMYGDAYYNIRYRNQRMFVNAERFRGRRFFALYAPIVNARGNMIAMVCVPYLEQNIDFRNEALFYGASFICLFLILIVVTMLISRAVVNNMFRPLEEMGRKMNTADVQGLSYIVYKRRDEVSTLVDAYNRMVHDLSESMKQTTQAERDKAWSEMARQVAHEIKNPLTPIKLELQRLIRLKEKNDPSWSEKFERVSSVILEHIDMLTDTANEFSTFAKLYTEEPVLLDLDAVLKDQMLIFDNKDNITMSYIGLPGSYVMAPRPQLIRVFVNLITNAVQAVEISQNEVRENGNDVVQGQILVSLRNSVKDGFYDIVVEDNGPGVKEENRGRLFAPNFTTKSGGTGLGLAICRNIIEKCGGTISYQKSFAFSGACFIVSLPKHTRLLA